MRIQVTYDGGADIFLRLQRWEEGKWLDFPVTHEDRPVRPVHYLCRIWAAELLPASLPRPRLRREGQTFVLVITA